MEVVILDVSAQAFFRLGFDQRFELGQCLRPCRFPAVRVADYHGTEPETPPREFGDRRPGVNAGDVRVDSPHRRDLVQESGFDIQPEDRQRGVFFPNRGQKIHAARCQTNTLRRPVRRPRADHAHEIRGKRFQGFACRRGIGRKNHAGTRLAQQSTNFRVTPVPDAQFRLGPQFPVHHRHHRSDRRGGGPGQQYNRNATALGILTDVEHVLRALDHGHHLFGVVGPYEYLVNAGRDGPTLPKVAHGFGRMHQQ